MKTHRTIPLLAALLAVCATTSIGHAQGSKKAPKPAPADTASTPSATAALAGDSVDVPPADTAPKKRGGLMGKIKSVANNKTVRQVAKVAACTVVPGGQVIAGAIDAASSKGAAGAAQGVAGAATGSSCMPGMGGAAGLAGGIPAGGMPGGGMAPTGGAPMGLSAEQLAAMQAGGAGGAPMSLSAEQLAAMQAGMGGQAAMAAQMQQMQQLMAQMAPGAGAPMTEAPGQTVELSSDIAADLAKGKTIVRNIDWVVGAPGISPTGTPGFTQAMAQLAAAMEKTGGAYRLDLYLDERYEADAIKTLGAQRLEAVQAALSEAPGDAQSPVALEIGKTKKDKDPRLEIVRRK